MPIQVARQRLQPDRDALDPAIELRPLRGPEIDMVIHPILHPSNFSPAEG